METAKQTVPTKPSSKAPVAIKVTEEHITDPEKISDAFNEIYFTSLNVTPKPSEDLVTAESELDALLLNFVNTQITDKV